MEYTNNYDWSGLEFPVDINDIHIFEKKNGVSVTILSIKGPEFYVARNSKYKASKHVELLLITNDEKRHYTVIKSLSRLLGSSNSKTDAKYRKELHDLHNDLPFMCEKMEINGVEKLVPNLHDKKKYVIHIRALEQALKHGLILEKVHRAIEFDQSAWLKPYIDFNTELRTQVKNDFEKDFFKLMNNSVFCKTMKNIRKHRNINLVTNS